jgi:hypothetical protein
MTRLEALRGLYDAVKVGKVIQPADAVDVFPMHAESMSLPWLDLCKASQGDMNAALALIAATLPGWDYQLWNLGTDEAGADLIHPDYSGPIHEIARNQATALLLACLAALIAVEEGKG